MLLSLTFVSNTDYVLGKQGHWKKQGYGLNLPRRKNTYFFMCIYQGQ